MIHPELWNRIKQLSPEDVCRRSGATESPDGGYLLDVFNKRYRIDPQTKRISLAATDAPSRPPRFHMQLTIANYLICAKNLPLSGEWIPPRQLPTGDFFFRGYHEMPTKKLAARFGTDSESFKQAGLALGGKIVDMGDAAVDLQVFPRLPVRLALWLGDDEFPPEIRFLFDRTADKQMLLDGLWSVGFVVRDEMLAAAPAI